MIQQRWCAALLTLVACGGGGSSAPVAPANSAVGVVEGFMQAVADSNLTRMAQLWGASGGPAARTRQPADYERRIAIMQAYLRNESHRLLPSTSPGSDARQDVQVEIRRELCTWVVPFTAIKTGDGWLVNQVDLAQAGNPARPCAPRGAGDSAPRDTSVGE
ncbi:MAG: hypothetical protein H0T68_00645 [Gemmatimonadales bacterium]|nr:hypothetical protein [Gemmatimonadales bacterium]